MTDPQTSSNQTVVGLFDNFSEAQAVARDLEQEGFARGDISIVANDATGEYASKTGEGHTGDTVSGMGKGAALGGAAGLALGLAALAIPGIGPIVAAGPLATALTGAGIGAVAGGLIGALTNMGVPEEDAKYYSEGVREGGALVMVKASGDRAHRAATILERSGAANVEENSGTAVPKTTPAKTSAKPLASGARANVTGDREVTLPVVEEEIAVGKRAVSKGGVRVFSEVTEKPVQESVNLRDEHVHVERRPVNRDASEADFQNFQEGTIEVRETAEEPVVSKRKRVVEEVVVGKDVTSRTEQVSDKVRRTDVKVEKIGASESGRAASGADYNESSPGYLYGSSLANDARYRGKEWSAIESDVRRDWDSRGEGTWESAKDSVRRAWEKMTGQW